MAGQWLFAAYIAWALAWPLLQGDGEAVNRTSLITGHVEGDTLVGMIREDLEIMGPVKLSEVEGPQQNIVKTVRRLESEGRIAISRGGGDEFI